MNNKRLAFTPAPLVEALEERSYVSLAIDVSVAARDLGVRDSVTESTIRNWAGGRNAPPADMLPPLAVACDCAIADFFVVERKKRRKR